MNKTNAQLIDLLDDWYNNIYQEVYHEKRELDKCKNLDKAQSQWQMISQSNDNDVSTYIFENTYLKKSVQIVDDYVIGFFQRKISLFFFILTKMVKHKLQLEILNTFKKMRVLAIGI